MKYYINVTGGLGYNIALARVITQLDDSYSFFIKTPYWDVFSACPKVKYVYKENEGRDFIIDAIKDKAVIVQHRLYDMDDFINKRLNYTQAWLKLLGISDKKEFSKEMKENDGTSFSKLELNPTKIFPTLKNQLNNITEDIKAKGYKDFILVQFWGGQSPLINVPNGDWSQVPYDLYHEPLKRIYPVDKAQEFIDRYKKSHPKTAIVQYSLPNEPPLNNCEHYMVPYLVYYELAKMDNCKGAVTIDSSLQHIVSGLCKTVVLWGHSLPKNFGYKCNKNIIQSCDRTDIFYFTELGPSGTKIDYAAPAILFHEVESYIG